MVNVVFRTDASRILGHGHVTRCLTLAGVLRQRDVRVSFVCREQDGDLCHVIEERAVPVARIPMAGTVMCDWEEDAAATRAAIQTLGVRPDWLVVDHYALDHHWEGALRPLVGRIMVIDDLADRVHDCDLLLDQNLVARMGSRYTGQVPPRCPLLLGPEYALLQPHFAEWHDRIPAREGAIERIVISFGGADTDNLTGRVMAAFLGLGRSDIEVDVVTPAVSVHADALRQQAAGTRHIHFHHDLPSLAPLMAKADLAIGAGGATSLERLCLGLPALVVTVAENQRASAEELHERRLIRWLGHRDEVDEAAIAVALDDVLQSGLDREWSERCRAVVDGRGADRVRASLSQGR